MKSKIKLRQVASFQDAGVQVTAHTEMVPLLDNEYGSRIIAVNMLRFGIPGVQIVLRDSFPSKLEDDERDWKSFLEGVSLEGELFSLSDLPQKNVRNEYNQRNDFWLITRSVKA